MDPRLKPILEQMRLNHGLLQCAVRDMSEQDLAARTDDKGNSVAWIAGHLAGSRHIMAGLVGLEEQNPFGNLYIRGAEVRPDSDYPPVSEIITAFENITDALTPCFDKIDASELDAELKDPYPVQEKTVLNGLAFLSFHETYHIGQIGFIRKLLGYPTLAG